MCYNESVGNMDPGQTSPVSDMTQTATCPRCAAERLPRQYLCARCWSDLPQATREALWQDDGQAVRRYRELLAALAEQRPLADIRIA